MTIYPPTIIRFIITVTVYTVYATRCIEGGMPAKVLQTLLGHTDIKTTLNTYCDAFSEYQDTHVKQFEEYMNKNFLIG